MAQLPGLRVGGIIMFFSFSFLRAAQAGWTSYSPSSQSKPTANFGSLLVCSDHSPARAVNFHCHDHPIARAGNDVDAFASLSGAVCYRFSSAACVSASRSGRQSCSSWIKLRTPASSCLLGWRCQGHWLMSGRRQPPALAAPFLVPGPPRFTSDFAGDGIVAEVIAN